jgi:hypothetical protein
MSKWERLDIYQRDGFRCLYCGFDGSTFENWRFLEIDHVNPAGPDEPENLVTCCKYCNGVKWKEPCQSVEQAREIVQRHNTTNRAYWEHNVKPRLRQPERKSVPAVSLLYVRNA